LPLGAFAGAAAAGRLIGGWPARGDNREIGRRRRDAELCARADRQHAQVLCGDQRGTYGDYRQ